MEGFLFYDASLVYRDNKKINTIVVYSPKIESANTYLDAGSIKYSIETFYMKDINGDNTFKKLKGKVKTLLKQLVKKFGKVPIKYKKGIGI